MNSTAEDPAANAVVANKSHKINLSSHAPIEEFYKFREAMKHPASRLDIDVFGEQSVFARNEVTNLCEEVLAAISDFQTAMEELSIWKNEFVKQSIPSSVKLSLVLLFSRLFRSNSSLHEPLFELVRVAKTYSQTWISKEDALVALEEDYRRQKKALEIAIRKMEIMKAQAEKEKREVVIRRWENLVVQLLNHHKDTNVPDGEAMMEAFRQARRDTHIDDVPDLNDLTTGDVTDTKDTKPITAADYLPKVVKSLMYALSRIIRRQHPNLKEILYWNSKCTPCHEAYISETCNVFDRSQFDQFVTSELKRTKSVANIRTWRLRQGLTRFRMRSNSFSFAEELALKQIELRGDIDVCEERTEQLMASSFSEVVDKPVDVFENVDDEEEVEAKENELDEEQLQAMVNNFLKKDEPPQKVRFDELWDVSSSSLLKDVDVDDTWFSLRDVMELILLHTQQMYTMQNSHEMQMREVGAIVNKNEVAQHECGAIIFSDNFIRDSYELSMEPHIDVQNFEEYFSFHDEHKQLPEPELPEEEFDEAKIDIQSESGFVQPKPDSKQMSTELTTKTTDGLRRSVTASSIQSDAFRAQTSTMSRNSTAVNALGLGKLSNVQTASTLASRRTSTQQSFAKPPSTFNRTPAPTFHQSEAMMDFFKRMNQFLSRKLDKHQKLTRKVRTDENKNTESKLRAFRFYSNGDLDKEGLFDFSELDAARKEEEQSMPTHEPPTRQPKGAFVNVSSLDPSFEPKDEEPAHLHTVNLYKDRRKNKQNKKK